MRGTNDSGPQPLGGTKERSLTCWDNKTAKHLAVRNKCINFTAKLSINDKKAKQ